MTTLDSKECQRCHATKPTAEFSKSKTGSAGLHSYCRPCAKEYKQSRKGIVTRSRTTDPNTQTKSCTRCEQIKPLAQFRKMPTGWHSWCLDCARAYDRERHQRRRIDPAYREAARGKSTAWFHANRERALKRQREYNYRVKYGLAVDDYHRIVAHQGGGCGICGRPDNGSSIREFLGIDHNHTTGTVRGALCDNCNRGLGLFGDDPERLRRAVDYLTNPPFNSMS